MCFPNLFRKKKIPKKLPLIMELEIKKLKKTKSKLACLKHAFNFVKNNVQPGNKLFFRNLRRSFVNDIFKLWDYIKKDGFLYCTQQNYLIRILLIKSGKFKEKDIALITYIRKKFFIHQYMQIKINNKWIDVDVWFAHFGTPFGKHYPVLFRIWPKIV